jgi:hypothetical protein
MTFEMSCLFIFVSADLRLGLQPLQNWRQIQPLLLQLRVPQLRLWTSQTSQVTSQIQSFEFVNITRLHPLTLVIWTDSPREGGGVENVVDSPETHPQDPLVGPSNQAHSKLLMTSSFLLKELNLSLLLM